MRMTLARRNWLPVQVIAGELSVDPLLREYDPLQAFRVGPHLPPWGHAVEKSFRVSYLQHTDQCWDTRVEVRRAEARRTTSVDSAAFLPVNGICGNGGGNGSEMATDTAEQ